MTDQGPQGGDEINVGRVGANYGWPEVTYGTQYAMRYWPPAPEARNHGAYEEPAFVWVPSIAVSGLVQVDVGPYEQWSGDLVAISLRGQALQRIRTLDDDVVYVEPISIGHRLRDVAEGRDGSLVLWSDDGSVIRVAPSGIERTGEALYAECAICHEAQGAIPASAPPLRGVNRREIASVPGYEYSNALRDVDGYWEWELGDFLRNPGIFAPGTSMQYPGVRNEDDLEALLEFLRHYD
jgi:cytochrome c2